MGNPIPANSVPCTTPSHGVSYHLRDSAAARACRESTHPSRERRVHSGAASPLASPPPADIPERGYSLIENDPHLARSASTSLGEVHYTAPETLDVRLKDGRLMTFASNIDGVHNADGEACCYVLTEHPNGDKEVHGFWGSSDLEGTNEEAAIIYEELTNSGYADPRVNAMMEAWGLGTSGCWTTGDTSKPGRPLMPDEAPHHLLGMKEKLSSQRL